MIDSSEPSDEELMLQYRAGSEAAFSCLYQRHSARVFGFLITRLRDRSLAEDVFQATFLKLHRFRSSYDPTLPFLPWLFTICRNAMIDVFRKKGIKEENLGARDAEIVAPNNEESTLSLEGLSPKQKQVIEMRYLEDLPFSEIARRLETSPSNARQLVSRAVKKLRDLMGFLGDSEGI